ncbi:aspartate/glutamate racemase family protein [Candidimonas humi]|uniref:Aspartate/glutamate racemase family protein n=1 Tax=Candidimonas humi TaxID=683355 RepID=A0ABV8NXE7_9BURK|nr:aspartate/glutamate racemase family protein [Candidimonas humi]MBV6305070.1 aspartate/glutamate racemase family protein [Candidimonas humi]
MPIERAASAAGSRNAPLGILMLDTRFPRPPGDIGNPATFSYPVIFKSIAQASTERVVRDRARGLVEAFRQGARELQAQGCAAIVSSCGFLALHQRSIADAVSIPVATSALLWVPMLQAMLPTGRKAGVVTATKRSLSPEHLAGAGAAADTPIAGVCEDGEFARVILGDLPAGDFVQIGKEIVQAAQQLLREYPAVGALVLECTNMRPYAAEIRRRCKLPVFDLVDLADLWMRRAIEPAG